MMNCKDVLVSVIVPVFNQERYVDKCLSSICKQTYSNLEIIVVNDGSTDGSLKILEKYAEKDSRIRIVNKPNEGTSFARRDGLRIANGEYVTFVDSDDYLKPCAINYLKELITSADNIDLVVGNYYRRYGPFLKKTVMKKEVDVNKVITPPLLFDKYYKMFFGYNFLKVTQSGNLYRKDIIDQSLLVEPLFDSRFTCYGEDAYFNLLLFPYLRSVIISDMPTYIYRYGGITTRYNPKFSTIFAYSDVRVTLLDKYNYSVGYFWLFFEYRNYLLTECLQRMRYLKHSHAELSLFLEKELANRMIVQRMSEYYKGREVPHQLKPILENDIQSLLKIADEWKKKDQLRFTMKQLVSKFI